MKKLLNQKYNLNDLLSIKEASSLLNVHPNTLREWDRKGFLKPIRIGIRGARRYKKEDILNALNGNSSSGKNLDNSKKPDKPAFDKDAQLNHYINLFEDNLDAVIILNTDFKIIGWNNAAQEVYGYKKEEVIGKDNKIIEEAAVDVSREGIIRELLCKGKWKGELIQKRKDKTPINILASSFVIKDDLGDVFGIVSINRNITEEKKYDKELKKLASLVEYSDDAIYSRTLDGTLTSWNKGAEKLFGYKADEIIGKSAAILIPKDRKKELIDITDLIKRGEKVYHAEMVREKKDGTLITVSVTVSPIKDVNGKIVEIFIVCNDITERKKAEQKLREQATLLQISNDAFIVLDEKNKILSWSDGAERLYGWSSQEALGKIGYNLLKTQYPIPLKELNELVKKQNFWHGELIHTTREGKKIIVESYWHILENNGSFKILEVNRDITERVEHDQRRDEFLNIVSHELKTPLTTVKAYAQILGKKLKDNSNIYFLTQINDQVEYIKNLINDLLDLGKITGGKLILNKEECDLDELIRKIVVDFQYSTDTHEIIKMGELKRKIIADKERINQVLINLLTNAIKYSPEADKIIVNVKEEKKYIQVYVEDFGIGIPKKDQKRIFDRYFTVDEKNRKGFGLGLYISSEIVKKHGGRIWVESQKGKGSKFFFTLPLQK